MSLAVLAQNHAVLVSEIVRKPSRYWLIGQEHEGLVHETIGGGGLRATKPCSLHRTRLSGLTSASRAPDRRKVLRKDTWPLRADRPCCEQSFHVENIVCASLKYAANKCEALCL